MAPNRLHAQCSVSQKDNDKLSGEKTKDADNHMQNCDFVGIAHVAGKHLWGQLWASEKEVE